MFRVAANFSDVERNFQEDILFLYEIIDQKVQPIIEEITSSIIDVETALQAKEKFDKNWFCDLIASVEAKIKIAILLKKICSKFKVSSITWDLISGNSAAMLEQIDILQNKDKFRNNFEG